MFINNVLYRQPEHLYNKGSQGKNFFIKVPYDVEVIYSINLNNLNDYNMVFSKSVPNHLDDSSLLSTKPNVPNSIIINNKNKLELFVPIHLLKKAQERGHLFLSEI